jgi:hypothetical protein
MGLTFDLIVDLNKEAERRMTVSQFVNDWVLTKGEALIKTCKTVVMTTYDENVSSIFAVILSFPSSYLSRDMINNPMN